MLEYFCKILIMFDIPTSIEDKLIYSPLPLLTLFLSFLSHA